jgi:aminoglycoside phosphotransferase (APT) family kinase protein
MTELPAPGTDLLIEPLSLWLQQKTEGARDVVISDVFEPAQGFSNKTICFRATWMERETRRERQLVARIQRHSDCPLLADIFHQWRVMEAIAANSDAAVPRLVLAEPDAAILGAPFYLMERVEGRVPPDYPSYHAEGWFADLTAEERERTWWNGIKEMARAHSISWHHFPFMTNGATKAPAADFYLENFVQKWYQWAAHGREYPIIDDAIRLLSKTQPPVEHSGLVWNDARMGNTMFGGDLKVASLFDFDVATLGPAEIDLAWWIYMDDVFSTIFGIARAAGVPDRDAAVKGFERIYGRSMNNFEYYEAVAALKHAVISLQHYGNDKMGDQRTNRGLEFATSRLQIYLSR